MTDVIYFSNPNAEIPRIVAAKLKRQLKIKIGFNDCGGKIRISGDLRIVDRSFRHSRYAEVRDGCMVLYRYVGNNRVWDFHIALHNLIINLDSPKHYCQFSLSRFGEITPIATFQVVKEQTYKKWLKCLAVEIIRQTPLNTLKFMDILFINELLEKRQDAKAKLKSKPAGWFLKVDKVASPPSANHRLNTVVNYSNSDGSNSFGNNIDEKPLNGNSCQLYKDFDSGYHDSLNISYTCDELSPPLNTASTDTFERDYPYPYRGCCYCCFQCCRDLPDDRIKLNYSFDSGYCSLQSAYSAANKCEAFELEIENHQIAKKPFEELFSKFECQQKLKPFKTKIKKSDCVDLPLDSLDKVGKYNCNDINTTDGSDNEVINESSTSTALSSNGASQTHTPERCCTQLHDKQYHLNNSNNNYNNNINNNNNNNNNNSTENLVLHHRSCNLQNTSVVSEENSRNVVEIVGNSTAASTCTFWPTLCANTNVDCCDCRHFNSQFSHKTYTTPMPDKFGLKEKSFSHETKTHANSRINARCINSIPDVLKDLPDTFPRSKRKPPSVSFHLSEQMVQNEYENENISASLLVRLITKCQIDKEYVPVKEKRMLFESLSRLSFSVDNLRKLVKCTEHSYFPKCRSLCDLNVNHVPVSVMKTYFESFNQTKEK